MKMNTRRNLIRLFESLKKASTVGNAKFKYAALKNLRAIDGEIEILREIEKGNAEILAIYNENYSEIIKKYGEPTADGNITVLTTSPNYAIAIEELEVLKEKFKDDIELFTTKQNEYQNLLAEEIDFNFNFHEVIIDNVPDDFADIEIFMDFEIIK